MLKRKKYQVHSEEYKHEEGLIERKTYIVVPLSMLYEPSWHSVTWKHVRWLIENWNWKLRGDIWVYKTDKGYMVLEGNHRTYAMKAKGIKRVKVQLIKPHNYLQYWNHFDMKEEIMEAREFVSRFYDYHNDYGTDKIRPIWRSTP